MGVNDILPRILPSAGRENYDLRALKDGIVTLQHVGRRKRERYSSPPKTKGTWIRRKVRLAIDVNGWISRACHGNGSLLLDARHLSYHGRAMLRRERMGSAVDADSAHEDQPSAVDPQQLLEYVSTCVQFIIDRINYLTFECSTQVLLVFDGATPPIKRDVVSDRRERRSKAVEERDGEYPLNDTGGNEVSATEKEVHSRISASKRAGYGNDASVRSALLTRLCAELTRLSLPFLIAPYEADGQLAFLADMGMIDAVITEDSDLIGYGVRRLIYKLGGWNGSNHANRGPGLMGTLLERRNLSSAHGIDLMDFSDAMLVVMFVSAGCDYCPSLRGIGIVTARDIVARVFLGPKLVPVLKAVLQELYQSCRKEVRKRFLPENEETDEPRDDYERMFLGAVAIFRHSLVYDPILGKDVIVNDMSANADLRGDIDQSFLKDETQLMEHEPYRKLVTDLEALYLVVGRPRPPDIARKVADGSIDPRTVELNSSNHNTAASEAGRIDPEEVYLDLPTRETTSGTSGYSHEGPFSQEFIIGGGTQQSKSSSSNTGGNVSSLSPDLLATPSPVKNN